MECIWNENNERLSQYLECEVLLLADVFEKFRSNSINNYGLCPNHYLSSPAVSWDALLNMTKVESESLTFPKDIGKLTIIIENLMIQNKNQSILFMWMQIIYVTICLNFLQLLDLNGLLLKILT